MHERIFEAFEDRENHIRDDLGSPVPSRHLGPRAFFADLQSATADISRGRRTISLVPGNPFDCLAFDRVALVLKAVPSFDATKDEIEGVAVDFGIRELLDRYIYSLSGGEAMKLALAKSALEQPRMEQLAIVTPWNSLSYDGYQYLEKLNSIYKGHGKKSELLSLRGDTDFEAVDVEKSAPHVRFGIDVANLKIPLTDPDRVTALPTAIFSDFSDQELISPCRLFGLNGQGKSLFAKALAGVIDHSGVVTIKGRNSGRARLLFQDASGQMLLSASSLEIELQENRAAAAYQEILAGAICHAVPELVPRVQGNSLLAIKLKMIAVRVANSPMALILDEPDWGLTKVQAFELVRATIDLCNKVGIPILVITHRQWFDRLFNTQIDFSRKILNRKGDMLVDMARAA
jgi:energy-coupling factor transporter ATP-binding protein EcfA2